MKKYPSFKGPRLPLRAALSGGGGPVSGRWADGHLQDESGRFPIASFRDVTPGPGDWLSGRLIREGNSWIIVDCLIHASPTGARPADDLRISSMPGVLKARADITFETRKFFRERNFLEVETPARVVCPAVEPYLHAFRAEGAYLATSPELHLKRLLTAGYSRIFEIARAFRKEEKGKLHLSEFSMLEWYRAWGSMEDILGDCEELIVRLLSICGKSPLAIPIKRFSYRELFIRFTGIDPFDPNVLADRGVIVQTAEQAGLAIKKQDRPEDIIDGLFACLVEPGLGSMGALFITEFSPWNSALARTGIKDEAEISERVELYLDGIEIANAYHELTDPAEHRKRIGFVDSRRISLGYEPYPSDGDFLEALDWGLPPCSGIALGLDRLIMWLLDEPDVSSVVAFPDETA